jgi:hypothetical protein
VLLRADALEEEVEQLRSSLKAATVQHTKVLAEQVRFCRHRGFSPTDDLSYRGIRGAEGSLYQHIKTGSS